MHTDTQVRPYIPGRRYAGTASRWVQPVTPLGEHQVERCYARHVRPQCAARLVVGGGGDGDGDSGGGWWRLVVVGGWWWLVVGG